MICSLTELYAKDTEMKPKNYNEIKSILDIYVNADDMLDQEQLDARASLRAKADAATPALMILFKENTDGEYLNTDDGYRAAIIDIFRHSNQTKKSAAAFLAKQLESDVEQWNGQIWIKGAIEFITEVDPEQARRISRKALNYKQDSVKSSAVLSLAEVGTKEDIERLNTLMRQRRAAGIPSDRDGITTKADEAVKRISKRNTR